VIVASRAVHVPLQIAAPLHLGPAGVGVETERESPGAANDWRCQKGGYDELARVSKAPARLAGPVPGLLTGR